MPLSIPEPIRDALASAGGGLPVSDLLALGLSRGQVVRLVRDGALIRVARGCYALPAAREGDRWARKRSDHLRALAAVLTSDAVAARRTAALIWELPVSAVPAKPEIIRPPHARARAATRTLCTRLTRDEVEVVRGVKVTTLERTCTDLALDLPTPEALISLDAALRRGVNRLDVLDNLDRRGRVPNTQLARQSIDWADPFAESPVESRGRGTLMTRGVPRPECNLTFEFQGEQFRPDDWWVGTGLIGEADGRVKYERERTRADGWGGASDETLWQEKLRQQWFEAELGMTVFRWTDKEMRLAPDRAAKRWFTLAALPAVHLWTPPADLHVVRAPSSVRRR